MTRTNGDTSKRQFRSAFRSGRRRCPTRLNHRSPGNPVVDAPPAGVQARRGKQHGRPREQRETTDDADRGDGDKQARITMPSAATRTAGLVRCQGGARLDVAEALQAEQPHPRRRPARGPVQKTMKYTAAMTAIPTHVIVLQSRVSPCSGVPTIRAIRTPRITSEKDGDDEAVDEPRHGPRQDAGVDQPRRAPGRRERRPRPGSRGPRPPRPNCPAARA